LRAERELPVLAQRFFPLFCQNELACGCQLQPIDILFVLDDQQPFAS
jgi:hypothetical protein